MAIYGDILDLGFRGYCLGVQGLCFRVPTCGSCVLPGLGFCVFREFF